MSSIIHMVMVIDDCPFLLGFAFGFQVFINFIFLSKLWLSYLCSCLSLFDAIVELHAMDAIMLEKFCIGKQEWMLHVIEAYLVYDLYFLYLVGAFITPTPKSLV